MHNYRLLAIMVARLVKSIHVIPHRAVTDLLMSCIYRSISINGFSSSNVFMLFIFVRVNVRHVLECRFPGKHCCHSVVSAILAL